MLTLRIEGKFLMRISFRKHEASSTADATGEINVVPDKCPLCHYTGNLQVIAGYLNKDGGLSPYSTKELQIILQCPRNVCKGFSIAYYSPTSSNYNLFAYKNIRPVNYAPSTFSETISEISSEFKEIYNQAGQAESLGLDKIAGVGYRKALEFLIKDYLIHKSPENEETVKSKFLGSCISEDVTDENIKAVCARAVWLGNDETHYVRVWEQKDITDLKAVIQLATHWIDSEVLTARLIEDMPAPRR